MKSSLQALIYKNKNILLLKSSFKCLKLIKMQNLRHCIKPQIIPSRWIQHESSQMKTQYDAVIIGAGNRLK